MKHEYGILNVAELISANPDKWDNGTLNKFIDAAYRFSAHGGKPVKMTGVLKAGVFAASMQIEKSK